MFCACKQIFSFFPLSSFSFYTVQYRRVQYSTVIGQLPRVSTEDRVVSVFEPSVCLSVCLFFSCKQIFSFFPLSALSFYTVQYRRVHYSTVIGQLPRLSTEDEDRVVSVFEFRVCLSVCLFVCSFLVSKFSNFSLFQPSLFIPIRLLFLL